MRLSLSPLPGLVAAALWLACPGGALAQTEAPALRGSLALPRPDTGLTKPTAVTRIGATRAPAMPEAIDPLAVPMGTPPPAVPAALPSPALEPTPLPPLRRRPVEEDPYAPLGIRAGAFLLRPSLEVDVGYSDNPGQQPGPVKGAAFTSVLPRFDFESDWIRHQLRGSIQGGYTHYFGIEDPNRPTLAARLDGRADVARETSLDSELRFNLDTERIGSDGVPSTSETRPITLQYGGTLGATRQLGLASVSLRGMIDRNLYEETTPGENRDYTTYGGALRAGYEISPAVKPFVEVLADTRRRDDPVDIYGYRRDSDGLSGRIGAELNLTGALRGDASVGYGARRYDDPRLDTIAGLLADASIVWTPSALTTVRLRAGTSFDETTTLGSSGYTEYTAGIAVEHALRRNWVALASLGWTRDKYQGIPQVEDTYDASIGLEYKLSRSVAVKAAYTYERYLSTVPGTDYTANAIMVGLRLQR